MLGDVVELEATQDATGLCGREGLIEGSCQRRINSPQLWRLKIPQFS